MKSFEKLLQNLEGKLMEGQIFKVKPYMYIYIDMYMCATYEHVYHIWTFS